MKGAAAAMLLAAAALTNDAPTAGRLSLVFTADEEHGSEFGSRLLAERGAVKADAIVSASRGASTATGISCRRSVAASPTSRSTSTANRVTRACRMPSGS